MLSNHHYIGKVIPALRPTFLYRNTEQTPLYRQGNTNTYTNILTEILINHHYIGKVTPTLKPTSLYRNTKKAPLLYRQGNTNT